MVWVTDFGVAKRAIARQSTLGNRTIVATSTSEAFHPRYVAPEILSRGEVHDPVLQGHMVTVPEVRMAPDLRLATIYVMPLGGQDKQPVLDALERNKRYLRGEIARRVNLKFAPDIRFRLDDRFDEAERIEKLLRSPQVKRDLEGTGDDE